MKLAILDENHSLFIHTLFAWSLEKFPLNSKNSSKNV